jgi:26S proteasome regulatory subunit N3
MNIILRSYLHENLYEQARNFIVKTTFPEQASNNQYARYLYYLGRIKAVQLEYSEA